MINLLIVSIAVIILIAMLIHVRTKKCRHLWHMLDKQVIVHSYDHPTGKIDAEQTVALMECKNCGELNRINLTTGKFEILREGGTIEDVKIDGIKM